VFRSNHGPGRDGKPGGRRDSSRRLLFRYNDAGGGLYNGNHYVGAEVGTTYRGGVLFTIPAGQTVLAAELALDAKNVPDGPNTLEIYEVTASGAVLIASGGGVATYTDLGDGPQYASVPGVTSNLSLSINLDATAIAAINAAQGGQFAVGLVNANATNTASTDGIFGGGLSTDIRDLVLTRAGPAPVPTLSDWAMILFGLILAGGAAVYIQRREMAA